ncbi:MAG: hypothetical protein KTR14_03065 [Vampirovibrio sp.]|nr:hypothetical protein [Vampirovibrio sp.]
MDKKQLETLLDGQELMKTIDVKTLVLDSVREMNEQELMTIFWDKLPEYSEDYISGYFYMKRS